MKQRVKKSENGVFFAKVPMLVGEDPREVDYLVGCLTSEINPRGIVEHMYVVDIANIIWETLRLRRCKITLVNLAFRHALEKLLLALRDPGVWEAQVKDDVRRLAQDWFTSDTAKQQVLEILKRYELEESAIEAEAIRISCDDLAVLDRMLASLEARRYRALRNIAEYRYSFAAGLRESADRIIDGEEAVPLLVDASTKKSAA